MDTSTLTDALRSLQPESFRWKFGLYSVSKDSDGISLVWNLCSIRGIAEQITRQKEYLLKKPVPEKPVCPFDPAISEKENVGSLSFDDPRIKDPIVDMVLSFQKKAPVAIDDFVSGVLRRPVGYAFYGEKPAGNGAAAEQVVLLRRTNPFLPKAADSLYIDNNSAVVKLERPVLSFSDKVDFLLIGGYGYLFTPAIRRDWSLEERHFVLMEKRMKTMLDTDIFSHYENLEQEVSKGKNARKFIDFDNKILKHILDLPASERGEFLTTYGVETDGVGRIDCASEESCELLIDLLCCRSCLDPLGRLSVGKDILPRL